MTVINFTDIETTGLEQAKGHRIIEICCSTYIAATRKKVFTWTKRINPMRSIDAKAQAVHKISLADLAGCPTWDVVAPDVAKILGRTALLVAHNGNSFDFPFIGMELMRIGITPPDIQSFDTMVEGRWATATGKVPTLGELAYACDVPYDPEAAHAAEYDVDVMAECFWRGVDFGFFKPAIEIPAVSPAPLAIAA
ncbi:3'-5' exonuclease [Inquilinus sp. OTU3971]|uniref:3'-5' exonuclease n=1 Tax=Inquilinus sp. OTU3971 TaxID=3043855 RepID=UPI00313B850A